VPSIILPFAFDQAFWGARVNALGLGPAPIPQKKLSANRLARAIVTAVNNANMKQRARKTGKAIQAENGLENALEIVRRHFGEPV
jgi:sterol 3beta-glucosyltransferase